MGIIIAIKPGLSWNSGRNTIDFNDVHRFSLADNKWEKIMTEGETPTERRRHTVEVCGNQVVLFGGFNGTYFNSMCYLNIPVS